MAGFGPLEGRLCRCNAVIPPLAGGTGERGFGVGMWLPTLKKFAEPGSRCTLAATANPR